MAEEEIVIELAPQPPKKRFFLNRRLLLALIAICLVLAAALFSWWLSLGKISSISARLDALIYTVAPESSARLQTLYAHPNEIVIAGQPLAKITLLDNGLGASETEQHADPAARQEALRATEKETSDRLVQARLEEERAQKVYQETVSDHVRAQLAMRSINRSNQMMYNNASEIEAQARRRAEAALENFEKISRYRASLEQTLLRTRRAIRQARLGKVQERESPAPTTPVKTTDLVAPAAGQILAIHAEQGQLLAPGQSVFFILPEDTGGKEARWIQAWFPIQDRDKLKIGQKALVHFENSNLDISGIVTEISEEAQSLSPNNGGNSSKSYIAIKISVNDPQQIARLTPGTKASCQIQTRYSFGWFF